MATICSLLVVFFFVGSSKSLQVDLQSFEYQRESTERSLTFNATAPKTFIEITPCNGHFNWTLANAANQVISTGRHGAGKPGMLGQLTSSTIKLVINSSIGSQYTLNVSAGYAGWKSPYIFYIVFVSSSAGNANRPQLPANPALTPYLTTNTSVSLSWDASTTPNVEYCIYYHPTIVADDSFVHSSSCSNHFMHPQASDPLCTSGTTYNLTRLAPGTDYTINMIAKSADNKRSSFLGVAVQTLETTDGIGEWAIVGREGPTILSDGEVFKGSLSERNGRNLFMEVLSGSAIKMTVKPCGGYFHWDVLGQDKQELSNGEFNSTGFGGLRGSFQRVAIKTNIQRVTPGIYAFRLRAGCRHSARCDQDVSFELLATTKNETVYPELPANNTLHFTEVESNNVTLTWDPSPTEKVTYCVIYYPASIVKAGDVESSSCSVLFSNQKAVGELCTNATTITLKNQIGHLLHANTTYRFNLVVVRQDQFHIRTSYKGVEVTTRVLSNLVSPINTASTPAAAESASLSQTANYQSISKASKITPTLLTSTAVFGLAFTTRPKPQGSIQRTEISFPIVQPMSLVTAAFLVSSVSIKETKARATGSSWTTAASSSSSSSSSSLEEKSAGPSSRSLGQSSVAAHILTSVLLERTKNFASTLLIATETSSSDSTSSSPTPFVSIDATATSTVSTASLSPENVATTTTSPEENSAAVTPSSFPSSVNAVNTTAKENSATTTYATRALHIPVSMSTLVLFIAFIL
eukprot:m.14659 g.14659  ORF g.14659 m.14659 type:complete len:750 (+) comp25882_c0_seq2:179-2428(+)